MAEPVRIAHVDELPPEGEVKEFACRNRMVCIARINGELSALDNVCIHQGGPLGQGYVWEGRVTCPWHGWEFDPKTGKSKQHPEMGVAVYKVRVEGDDVFVEDL